MDMVLHAMENLKVLTYMGNPIVRKTKNYRRKMILSCEKLTYLDTRPITPKDRKQFQSAILAPLAAAGPHHHRHGRLHGVYHGR